MDEPRVEKFGFSGIARLGSKRVTVWSSSGEDKVKVVLPRDLLETFLDKNDLGFESVSYVSWDKESFECVKGRWFHKSLVSSSGKSLRSKIYRKSNVRLSRAEVYWFSKLIYESLLKAWTGAERNQANVSIESLGGFRSSFKDNGDTLWIRLVKVLLKHICKMDIWSKHMIAEEKRMRRFEGELDVVVAAWFKDVYMQIDRWQSRQPVKTDSVSDAPAPDGEKSSSASRFIDRLRTMDYYSVDSKWLYSPR